MGNALKIEVAGSATTGAKGLSAHKGTYRFAMYLLAEIANDADRYGVVYVAQLADALGLTPREAKRILRHLESSGEITLWNRVNDSMVFAIADLEYHLWPTAYRNGELLDGRSRRRWTAEDDDNRRASAREAQRARKSARTNRDDSDE